MYAAATFCMPFGVLFKEVESVAIVIGVSLNSIFKGFNKRMVFEWVTIENENFPFWEC